MLACSVYAAETVLMEEPNLVPVPVTNSCVLPSWVVAADSLADACACPLVSRESPVDRSVAPLMLVCSAAPHAWVAVWESFIQITSVIRAAVAPTRMPIQPTVVMLASAPLSTIVAAVTMPSSAASAANSAMNVPTEATAPTIAEPQPASMVPNLSPIVTASPVYRTIPWRARPQYRIGVIAAVTCSATPRKPVPKSSRYFAYPGTAFIRLPISPKKLPNAVPSWATSPTAFFMKTCMPPESIAAVVRAPSCSITGTSCVTRFSRIPELCPATVIASPHSS